MRFSGLIVGLTMKKTGPSDEKNWGTLVLYPFTEDFSIVLCDSNAYTCVLFPDASKTELLNFLRGMSLSLFQVTASTKRNWKKFTKFSETRTFDKPLCTRTTTSVSDHDRFPTNDTKRRVRWKYIMLKFWKQSNIVHWFTFRTFAIFVMPIVEWCICLWSL